MGRNRKTALLTPEENIKKLVSEYFYYVLDERINETSIEVLGLSLKGEFTRALKYIDPKTKLETGDWRWSYLTNQDLHKLLTLPKSEQNKLINFDPAKKEKEKPKTTRGRKPKTARVGKDIRGIYASAIVSFVVSLIVSLVVSC